MSREKHQDALRTIGEVARLVGVATHVLRFWESKFTQIKPQMRRGRRYYQAEDINTIKTIKELLYDKGYTLKGAQKFLKANKNAASEGKLNQANGQAVDLSGTIISPDTSVKTMPQFSAAEITKLNQLYRGLCFSRNRLIDLG